MTWEEPEWHASVGSTNLLALEDPRPGRVVVARHQSAGLGRRGRSWHSPPGSSLAVTAVVPAPAPAERGWLPLLGGLAVAEALGRGPYAVSARLKWPNDVLLAEAGVWRKVCGVLAQGARHTVHGDVVVLGAGLNLRQSREELPVPTATSWRLVLDGDGPAPEETEAWLGRYLRSLALRLAQPQAAREAYAARCLTLGAEVVVHLPGERTHTGRAVGLGEDGSLLVEGPDGVRVHHAGDVVHLRPGG
jgi:BirA family transcriptional regulator, biotin operon repressor / biotin---[acetyl-CoA-carboxylase] ligase